MSSNLATVDVGGEEYVVPGVLLEVLWDIEVSNCEGRRTGSRSVQSIWWRAEVRKAERSEGRLKAKLQYEARNGFAEQLGEVWVFQRHVRLVDDEGTQLRWRIYETSGNVSYDVDEDEDAHAMVDKTVAGRACDTVPMKMLQEQLGTVMHQYEGLERMVMGQNMLFSRLLGAGSGGDRECARLFATLRHKMAVVMQKPVPPVKVRKEGEESNIYFEDTCAGIISVDADCDFDTFRTVARVVRSTTGSVCFRPTFADMQFHDPSLEQAEIVFDSFGDLSRVLGITSRSDLIHICLREKGNCRQRKQGAIDVAIRVIGTCLIDTEKENTPVAILVCHSIHEESLSRTVDALIRESREFDIGSRTYRKRLEFQNSKRGELLKRVYRHGNLGQSECNNLLLMKRVSSQLRNFTRRWTPLPSPNSRTWSRKMAVSEFVSGIVEVEMPFLIFRGAESVAELLDLVTEPFIKRQLQTLG